MENIWAQKWTINSIKLLRTYVCYNSRGQWKPNDDVIPVALKCMTIDDTSLVSETLEVPIVLLFR